MFVLGVDGMDPGDPRPPDGGGADAELRASSRAKGSYQRLGTSNPPQSPVAWSNFVTGMDPGGHGVFDFVHRDPTTYLPISSATPPVEDPGTRPRVLRLGAAARARPRSSTTAAGRPWWDVLVAARRRHRGVSDPRQLPGAGEQGARCWPAWAPWTCAAATAPTRCSPTAPSSRDDPKGDIQRVTRAGLRPRRHARHGGGDAARARPTSSTSSPARCPAPSDYLTDARHGPPRSRVRDGGGEVGDPSARCCARASGRTGSTVELRRAAARA